MKIRVPFAWFWFGEDQYGTPEVESGTIASSNPTPPPQALARAAAMPPGPPLHNEGPAMREAALQPYRTPRYREQEETLEEKLERMQYEINQARSSASQALMGDDSARGGR